MNAGCRISRVRPKNSQLAEVVILREPRDKDRELVLLWVKDTLDHHVKERNVAGFAFAVWDERKQVNCFFQSWRSGISPAEGPDFVRRALMTYFIDKRAERVAYGPEEDWSA